MHNTALRKDTPPLSWPSEKLDWAAFWGTDRDEWSDTHLAIVEEWLETKAPLFVRTTAAGKANVKWFPGEGESSTVAVGAAALGVAVALSAGAADGLVGGMAAKRPRLSSAAAVHDAHL